MGGSLLFNDDDIDMGLQRLYNLPKALHLTGHWGLEAARSPGLPAAMGSGDPHPVEWPHLWLPLVFKASESPKSQNTILRSHLGPTWSEEKSWWCDNGAGPLIHFQ